MKTRKRDWIDTRGYKPQHGFQVWVEGRWRHATENGKPCLFDTPEERDLKQAEFRKMATPSNAGDNPPQPGCDCGSEEDHDPAVGLIEMLARTCNILKIYTQNS